MKFFRFCGKELVNGQCDCDASQQARAEFKHITCPCCSKEVNIPLGKFSTGFDFNYSILINSQTEFFDLVDICPECGLAMLFDNGVSDEMREYIKSAEYRNILNNNEIEYGLKKWILLAMVSENDENYTEAGIAYMKAYDYLELKDMELDQRLIEKAASCFLSAVEEYNSFIDVFLAVDCMRRDGEMEEAKRFLETISSTFSGELVDELVWKEEAWINLKDKKKRYLEI